MSARALRRLAGTAFLAVLAPLLVGVGAASAIDPPGPGPLDRPIVDLALIDADGDPRTNGAPLLLAVDAQAPSGQARLALLDRTRNWGTVAEVFAAARGMEDQRIRPWLVQIAPKRFALLLVWDDEPRTSVLPITVTVEDDRAAIDVGSARLVTMTVDDAGAADVDDDGQNELILASATTHRGGDVCQGSVVKVLDGGNLRERGEWRVPDIRLAGGVLGAWDDVPGADLLAYAYGNCPAGPDSAQRLGLHVLRLVDGQPIVALSPSDLSEITGTGAPLAADLDGDGRDEAVIRDGAALRVLEPARGWAQTTLATGDVLPVAAVAAGDGAPGRVAWFDASDAGGLTAAIASVQRSADGRLAFDVETLDLNGIADGRRDRVVRAMRDRATDQAPPQAWQGVIEDGCLRILAPLLTTGCGTGADASPTIGPAWFATQPLATYDVRNRRELLIAATIEWRPEGGIPRAPTPAAAGAPGAWRHGPSVAFVLSEVRAADAVYFDRFPVPRPTIERGPVRTTGTDLPGFTGARVFARLIAIRPQDPLPIASPTVDEFFEGQALSRELTGVARIAVPAGAESGRDGSFVRLPLHEAESPDGLPPTRWTLTIVQINDWGELAGPIRQTIELDATGPSLAIEEPFLSAPWPFSQTIRGRTEPGVQIRGGTTGSVTADRRGRFEIVTQLAPWPQTLELVAIDEGGNTTTNRYSLVGGLDYRALPWPAILVGLLLAAAFVSTGRGSAAHREIEVYADPEPQSEIEELTPARPWRRARTLRP